MPDQRIHLPFPLWHVLYRYPHHAGPSGYDRICDYLGEEVRVDKLLYWTGETVLRPWAIADSKFGGQIEYSRYDWVLERALMSRMRRTSGGVFHVLYAEKNFRHSWKLIGRNGNQLIATLHHPPQKFESVVRSKQHFSFLSHAIVLTEQLREFAEALVGKGRVSVVPHGVDVEFFCPLRTQGNERPPTLTFGGSHLRDYDTLSKVVRTVLAAEKTAQFLLISKDERCKQIARAYPNRVTQMDRLSDEEYRCVLQNTDLLVLPLIASTAVNAALEAMACGVPVIATEGGVRDYILPEGGWTCSIGDARRMSEIALAALADPDRLSQAKKSARAQAMKFAWPLVACRTAEVYRLVAGHEASQLDSD